VGDAYQVRRPPDDRSAALPRRTTYLIDPEGRIVRSYLVKDVAGHPEEVLADLRRLSAS
jgi:peroxiredoxin